MFFNYFYYSVWADQRLATVFRSKASDCVTNQLLPSLQMVVIQL